jgi:DNA-binding MarR family transcriptional regulator
MSEVLSEREKALWRALGLMSRQLQTAVEQRLQQDAGISRADFEILQALADADGNQARARELADMLGWEKSRISHQVTRMVSRGLVRRTECATDLRGSWIAIAEPGHAALRDARPGYERVVRESFTSLLSESEAEALAGQALRVIAATDPGTCHVEVEALRRALDDGATVTG